MERKNGFLDLDLYFKDKDKKNIENSNYGKDHYWLTIKDEKYFFKAANYCYQELIAYYIAKRLGFNALYYDLAIFKNKKGVISKDYKKTNCKYYKGIDILKAYYENYPEILKEMGLTNDWEAKYEGPYVTDMNNLEIVWQALETFFKGNNKFNVKNLISQFVNWYIFGILIRSFDAGSYNWELEESESTINLVPFFDNGASFHKYSSTAFSTGFSDNETHLKTSLKRFLSISSREFVDLFIEKYNMFDINVLNNVISDVEKQIDACIPRYIQEDIYDIFNLNRTEIKEVLEELNLINKGR